MFPLVSLMLAFIVKSRHVCKLLLRLKNEIREKLNTMSTKGVQKQSRASSWHDDMNSTYLSWSLMFTAVPVRASRMIFSISFQTWIVLIIMMTLTVFLILVFSWSSALNWSWSFIKIRFNISIIPCSSILSSIPVTPLILLSFVPRSFISFPFLLSLCLWIGK